MYLLLSYYVAMVRVMWFPPQRVWWNPILCSLEKTSPQDFIPYNYLTFQSVMIYSSWECLLWYTMFIAMYVHAYTITHCCKNSSTEVIYIYFLHEVPTLPYHNGTIRWIAHTTVKWIPSTKEFSGCCCCSQLGTTQLNSIQAHPTTTRLTISQHVTHTITHAGSYVTQDHLKYVHIVIIIPVCGRLLHSTAVVALAWHLFIFCTETGEERKPWYMHTLSQQHFTEELKWISYSNAHSSHLPSPLSVAVRSHVTALCSKSHQHVVTQVRTVPSNQIAEFFNSALWLAHTIDAVTFTSCKGQKPSRDWETLWILQITWEL